MEFKEKFPLLVRIVFTIIIIISLSYTFIIILHFVLSVSSHILNHIILLKQTDPLTNFINKYPVFSSESEIKRFNQNVGQTAFGATIGTAFILFLNYLQKLYSETKNRITSLEAVRIIVESNIKSLLLLKQQFILPKFKATQNINFEEKLPILIKMSEKEFGEFLLSIEESFFKVILNPNYIIDLNQNHFGCFADTEKPQKKESLNNMLYHYCNIKENLSYLNEAIKYQNNTIKEFKQLYEENTSFPTKQRPRIIALLSMIKNCNEDTGKLLEAILVFLIELKQEISQFPQIPKSKHIIKNELLTLLPKEDSYKKVLDDWYYQRRQNRRK